MISLLWILACGPSSNDIAANLQSSNPSFGDVDALKRKVLDDAKGKGS